MDNMKTWLAGRTKWLSQWEFFCIGLLLVAAWISFPEKTGVFPLDDAYIHLAYVRNLAGTGTLCLNPGEPSLGISSPLWVVILAPFYLLRLDMYWVVQTISLCFFGIVCLLAADIARTCATRLNFSETEARFCALLTGLLLALSGNLHWFALSGMETMLYLALGLFSVRMYHRRGFDYVTGMTCGLMFLTRVTGVVLCITLIAFDLARRRYSPLYKGLISMALVIVPYLLVSIHITGNFLPTTVQGKLSTYVDGGTDWGRTSVSSLRNPALTSRLVHERIISIDEFDPNFFHFSNRITDPHALKELLQQAGISGDSDIGTGISGDSAIGTVLTLWRLSQKNRVYWYLRTLFLYQKYQPQNFLLLAVLSIVAMAAVHKYSGGWSDIREGVLDRCPECATLAIWGLLHLALYALSFRTLLHHTRYLADEYVIGAILGAVAIFILYRYKPRVGRVVATVSLVLAASTLLYWRDIYANNVRHVREVYIKMSDWINKNTAPAARIAAFDIGILRYVGNRYVIDLGGLVDPAVHPYLERRECGDYVRLKKADFILYSRNLETDYFTGIFSAEYQGTMLLKQVPVAHFETPQYKSPTLTHSYRMDLNRVIGWFPPTRDGILQAFSYDGRPFQPVGAMIDDGLEFVGYSIDQREIELIPYYPYASNFTFFYKALRPPRHAYWVHLAFFNPSFNSIVFSVQHQPILNFLPPDQWPLNQIVQEHHIRFVPVDLPRMKFRIGLTFNREEFLDEAHPERYRWFDLGAFTNKGNVLKPMDHQQLMALSL